MRLYLRGATMTHKSSVLSHLLSGNTLTQRGAYELFGITRLAAVIHRLKNDGHDIKSDTVTVKTRGGGVWISRYRMEIAQ